MAPNWKFNCLCCCKQLVHVLCMKMVQWEIVAWLTLLGCYWRRFFCIPTNQLGGGYIDSSLMECPLQSVTHAKSIKDHMWLSQNPQGSNLFLFLGGQLDSPFSSLLFPTPKKKNPFPLVILSSKNGRLRFMFYNVLGWSEKKMWL